MQIVQVTQMLCGGMGIQTQVRPTGKFKLCLQFFLLKLTYKIMNMSKSFTESLSINQSK